MTNHLARIPVELFIMICEVVHEAGEGPYLARIARAFVPVGRRLAFRKVEVKKRAHLKQLCEVVEACPAVGACILALRLVMSDDEDAVAGPTRVGLSSFFRRLVNVGALHVENMDMAIGIVLEAADDQAPVLPNLVQLLLKGASVGPVSLFDPSNYRELHKYDRLSQVDLLMSAFSPRPRDEPAPANAILIPLDRLALYGNLSDDAAVHKLLSSFESVTHLTLHDLAPPDSPSNTSPLLDALRAPALVQTLSLKQRQPVGNLSPSSLERFVNVELVIIGAQLWTSALIASFASLRHLEELRLIGCAGVPIAGLQALVSNRALCAHLKVVRLDHVPGDETPLPEEGLVDLLISAHSAGIYFLGSYMRPIYDVCRAVLQERKEAAAQQEARERVGAAAGAAPEEGGASASGTGEGQSET